MKNIIGREILIKRPTFQENIVIENVNKITSDIFHVFGRNSKRTMLMTMTKSEIEENLQ